MVWRSGADFLVCDKEGFVAPLEYKNTREVQGGVHTGRSPWLPKNMDNEEENTLKGQRSEDTEPDFYYYGWGCTSSDSSSQQSQVAEATEEVDWLSATQKPQANTICQEGNAGKRKSSQSSAWEAFRRRVCIFVLSDVILLQL